MAERKYTLQLRGDRYTGLNFLETDDFQEHRENIRKMMTQCPEDVWKLSFNWPEDGSISQRAVWDSEAKDWFLESMEQYVDDLVQHLENGGQKEEVKIQRQGRLQDLLDQS